MTDIEPTPRNGSRIPYSDAPAGVCRWCGEPLGLNKRDGTPDRRLRWHRDCIETYKLGWPGAVRQRVFERDKGVCRTCGLDCQALGRLISRVVNHNHRTRIRLNLNLELSYRDLWDADHVRPLVDGGSLEMSNLQTLCVWCHRRKTADEATRRAARKREAKASQMPLVTP